MKNLQKLVIYSILFFLTVSNALAQNIEKDSGAVIRKIVTSPGNDVYVSSFKGFVMMGNKPCTIRLLDVIKNYIYTAFYNNSNLFIYGKPCITIFKIDIDKAGKISNTGFSDSADSSLLKACNYAINRQNITPVISEYIRIKQYKDLSLLIPILYEPNQPSDKTYFTYGNLERLMKFNGKLFAGSTVLLPTEIISVLSEHNF